MTTPEVNGHSRGWEEILTPVLDDIRIASWAENELAEYRRLPKVNSQERKNIKSFVAQIAGRLLQNPQNIEIAADVWKNTQDQTGLEFYERVKKGSGELIKEKWEDVTSEQLAQLVGIYASNPQSKDFAKELLTSYFEGPENRRQRVGAYYTFVSCLLDLVGDDKAFNEGVRIGLHDTDILARDNDLIEQIILLSLPYNEEERVFQKLLIANVVVVQLSFLSSQDLGEARQRNNDFLDTNGRLKAKWNKEAAKAERQIGSAQVSKLNEAARKADLRSWRTLSMEEKLKLKDIWPFSLLFDEKDPLNKKLQEALPRITDLKMKTSPL